LIHFYKRLNNVVPRCFEISDGAAARERVRGESVMTDMDQRTLNIVNQELPAKICGLRELAMHQELKFKLGDVNQQFSAELLKHTSNPDCNETWENPVVKTWRESVREELSTLIESLLAIEVWISMKIPAISDGNNFGVEVQEHMVKFIQGKKEACVGLLDGLLAYSTERAGLWDKAVFPSVAKRSSSKGTKKCTGGEKETNEETESSDVATSFNVVSKDAIAAIAWLDAQHLFKLRLYVTEIFKAYATVYDQLIKNMTKVMDPRGEADGRGGGISMF